MRGHDRLLRWTLSLALVAVVAVPAALADYQTGMSYFKAGKYVEAAAEFQQLVDESPNYDYGYYVLGLSYAKLDKPQDAIQNFDKAIELNGDKFEYYYGLASAYMSLKNYRKTVDTLDKAEGLMSDNYKFPFYSMRGTANFAQRKWSDAITDLEKANAIKPSAAVLDNIGRAYFQLRHYDKAAKALQGALKINPSATEDMQLLSESLMNIAAGQSKQAAQPTWDDAMSWAEKYRAKNPGEFEAVNLVGRAALGAGEFQKAVQSFDKVLQMKPSYCYAMINRSKAYIALEKWSDAEKSLKQADQCDPNSSLVWDSLGFVYRKQEKLDESLTAYQKAYAIKPSSSIEKSIDEVKHNIEVAQFNAEASKKEEEQRLQAEAEKKRLEEEMKKREEWKKKHEDQ